MQGPMRGPGAGNYAANSTGHGAADGLEAWLEVRERLIRALEAENRELRRQLEALRRGVGIAVVIEGQTIALAPLPTATDPHAPAAPSDTRPEAARHARTGWQPDDSPAVPVMPPSMPVQPRPGGGPLPPTHSPAWGGGAGTGPHAVPAPWPVPSLPSMPTSQLPVMPAPAPSAPSSGASHPAALRHAPRTGAADDSWLTDQHPAATRRPNPMSNPLPNPVPRVRLPTHPATGTTDSGNAWLRSGVAWPDTTPHATPHSAPQQPMPSSAPPAFPPPTPPASGYTGAPQRPIRAPRTNRQGLAPGERPAERNVFADSFIL